MMHCTIIIVNWNTWEHLFRCLDALRQQTHQEFDVIVVDNAISRKDQVLKLSKFDRTCYVRNTANVGFAAANNQAVRLAEQSQWVMLLNPDTTPRSDWLATMLAAARDYPDVTMFGSRLVRADDPTILDGDGDAYHISGLPWRLGHGQPVVQHDEDVHEVFSPCAAAAMYRREDLLNLDGFDEEFFCYIEDVDLGFRMRLAGHRCLQVRRAVVGHVGSVSVGRHSDFYVYHSHRNLVWAYVKNMPWPLFWLCLPFHIGLNIASVLWLSLRGQGRTIVKAKLAAIRGLPVMWSKRRDIQARRTATTMDILRVLNWSPLPTRGRFLNS